MIEQLSKCCQVPIRLSLTEKAREAMDAVGKEYECYYVCDACCKDVEIITNDILEVKNG